MEYLEKVYAARLNRVIEERRKKRLRGNRVDNVTEETEEENESTV